MTRPLIGIGSDILQTEGERDRAFGFLTYVEALRRSGAIPLLLPPQPENVPELVARLDGVLLARGADCDPAVYGEACHPSLEPLDRRRQDNDLALAKWARERGVPALGICLGVQLMNVAAGGTLIQDIDSQHPTTIRHAREAEHRVRLDVRIVEGTGLSRIVAERTPNVNSSHHQAIGRVGEGLRVTATAPDGIVEGVEDPRHRFYQGVQWHPEDMDGEDSAAALFRAFVAAARRFAAEKYQATDLSPAVAEAAE